jgi:hypothetical protein
MTIEEDKYLKQIIEENIDESTIEDDIAEEYIAEEYIAEEDIAEEEIEDDTLFYFKYEFEGAKTIDDILNNIDRLRSIFEEYKSNGYKVREEVSNGYCFLDKE